MRLIIETGTGFPDANSYIGITDVNLFLPSAVLEKWNDLSEDEKIDRLLIASLFIDSSFNWKGIQKKLEQGMNWPRTDVYFQGHKLPDDYIPNRLKKAVGMALNLIMDFGLGVFQQIGDVQVKREKLGQLETEYFESLKTNAENGTAYGDINNILRGLYCQPGSVMTAEVIRK